MLRALRYSVPALALLVGGLAPAADRKEKPGGKAGAGKEAVPPADLISRFKELDGNKDGFLQRDEVPESWRHNFEKIDANKDGKIGPQELHRGAVYMQPRRRPSDIVFILVEMSDCDECCAEELERTYELLRKVDKNHDGKIDADEIKAARERYVADRVNVLLKALDKDKDSKISKGEARGLLREHFTKLDRNKDGSIDRKELTGAASERPDAAPAGGKESPAPKKGSGRPERR